MEQTFRLNNRTENAGWERYARQLTLPGFGREGQARLGRSRVLLLGAGGLGGVCAQYLVRAGVGRITVIDYGRVDLPDLNRQLLYTTGDLGAPKVSAAAKILREINPEVEVRAIHEEICLPRLREMILEVDIVLDALDNFPTRMIANEACCRSRKVLVHGGVLGTKGVASVVVPGTGPCLQCIYEEHDLAQPEAPIPVLGPTAGVIASIQAMETLQILLGAGPSLLGKLILFDGKSMNFFHRVVERKASCRMCQAIH